MACGQPRSGLASLNRAQKLVEMRDSVVRTRRCLRVILNAEHRQLTMSDAFDGPVIEVQVRHFEVARARHAAFISLYREPVVLRCYENSPASHLLHRVIATTMAVRKLDGRAAR